MNKRIVKQEPSGYIGEPEGADIFIKSDPLDDRARKEVSEALKAYRANQNAKKRTAVSTKSAAKAVWTAPVAKKEGKSRGKSGQ